MNGVSFFVAGTPMPKGSNTRMPNGAMLPAGTTASRARMNVWRENVRMDAINAMAGHRPFVGPIRLSVEFALLPPRSMRVRDWGWLPHTKRPDVDKLFRMLSDALTGVVWFDDSQVCFSAVNKVYAWDGRSGAHVDVTEIDDESAKSYAATSSAIRDTLSRL